MRLIRRPSVPHVSGYFIPYEYIHRHSEWQKFVPVSHRVKQN